MTVVDSSYQWDLGYKTTKNWLNTLYDDLRKGTRIHSSRRHTNSRVSISYGLSKLRSLSTRSIIGCWTNYLRKKRKKESGCCCHCYYFLSVLPAMSSWTRSTIRSHSALNCLMTSLLESSILFLMSFSESFIVSCTSFSEFSILFFSSRSVSSILSCISSLSLLISL